MNKSRAKSLILDCYPATPEEIIARLKYIAPVFRIETRTTLDSPEALRRRLSEAAIELKEKGDKTLIAIVNKSDLGTYDEQSKLFKEISSLGIKLGFVVQAAGHKINMDAAKENGVGVANCPGITTEQVSNNLAIIASDWARGSLDLDIISARAERGYPDELTATEIIRQLPTIELWQQHWTAGLPGGLLAEALNSSQLDIRNLKVLVIGSSKPGKFGHWLTKAFEAGEAKVECVRVWGDDALSRENLATKANQFDVVVMAARESKETENLLDESFFKALSNNQLICLIGRGNQYDLEALQSSGLKAVIDVVDGEPIDERTAEILKKLHEAGSVVTAHTLHLGYKTVLMLNQQTQVLAAMLSGMSVEDYQKIGGLVPAAPLSILNEAGMISLENRRDWNEFFGQWVRAV